MTQSTERLDEETERRLADFRYCALSDTSSDDLSPFTEAARDALRSRIRTLVEEARSEAWTQGYDEAYARVEVGAPPND